MTTAPISPPLDQRNANQKGNDTPSTGTHFPRMNLRLEQPVQDCAIQSHPYFNSGAGVTNREKVRYIFHWYRSSTRRSCCNRHCPGITAGIDLLLKAEIECLACAKLGISRDYSSFCSTKCLQRGWSQHRKLHEHHADFLDLAKPNPQEERDPYYNTNLSEKEEEWIDIGEKEVFIPSKTDVGYIFRVKCTPVSIYNENPCGPSAIVDTNIVLPSPPHAPKFQCVRNGNVSMSGRKTIRCMSYNVLADIYATNQMYPYCPNWALRWAYRRGLVLSDIKHYDPDVICFQELQADQFEEFYQKLMDLGYDGFLKNKTRQSMGGEGRIDGCAIFYKKDKYILKSTFDIEFNEEAKKFGLNKKAEFSKQGNLMIPDLIEAQTIVQRLSRGNIALVGIFEMLGDNEPHHRENNRNTHFCVVNTHIVSNPEFPDVKFWQSWTLLKELEKLPFAHGIPLIFCGDFNSLPASAVYEFLSTNRVHHDHQDLLEDKYQIFSSMNLSHHLRLASAYNIVLGEEPPYTNLTEQFAGTLDYIWYSRDLLVPIAAWKPHDISTLKAYVNSALPNCQFPSDHVPLCVEFGIL